MCFFCHQKVYAMERLSAEGLFFHRSCFACHACRGSLRMAAYRFHAASGKRTAWLRERRHDAENKMWAPPLSMCPFSSKRLSLAMMLDG